MDELWPQCLTEMHERLVATLGWDNLVSTTPRLWLMHVSPTGAEAIDAHTFPLGVSLPDGPAAVIDAIGHSFADLRLPGYGGAMFSMEHWMVRTPIEDTERGEAAIFLARQRRLYTHPDRASGRSTILVTDRHRKLQLTTAQDSSDRIWYDSAQDEGERTFQPFVNDGVMEALSRFNDRILAALHATAQRASN